MSEFDTRHLHKIGTGTTKATNKPAPFERPSIEVGAEPIKRKWWHIDSSDIVVGDTIAGIGTVLTVSDGDAGTIVTTPSGLHVLPKLIYAFSEVPDEETDNTTNQAGD